MSVNKKKIRQAFCTAVFARDNHRCRGCGTTPANDQRLDAHHITDRHLMPNGGYVKENGISLCPECHRKAEIFHETGQPLKGWSPDHLYAIIGSTYEQAVIACFKLTAS